MDPNISTLHVPEEGKCLVCLFLCFVSVYIVLLSIRYWLIVLDFASSVFKPFYKLYQKGDELTKKRLTLVAKESFLIHQNDCLKSLSAGDIFSCEEK